MTALNKREPLILLLGDIFFFLFSLWLALFIRHFELPTRELFMAHLAPFTFLLVLWIVVFYISGLYEKHTIILKSKLPGILFTTQAINSGLAVAFFYLVPFLDITPKTILFIYLVVSFAAILVWRRHGYFHISSRRPANAILIGSGSEMRELLEEVNGNPIYSFRFVSSVDLERTEGQLVWDEIVSRIYSEDVSIIAVDLSNEKMEPVLPHLYNLIFSKVSFIDMHKVYEDIFDRVPLSLLRYNWFLENVSTAPRAAYDTLKRIMDLVIASVLFLISVPVLVASALAIKLEGGGSVFSFQTRVGENNKPVHLIKLRTMTLADDKGEWGKQANEVTRVGHFLRRTRIDEFPQLLNVFKGDLSLIGPRPEFPAAVKQYSEEVPYYNVRHLVRPGLSGWAQIYGEHPHHGVDISKTKNKLSYDLYYIKNRSFMLDLKIALRTLKTLVSIAGR